MGLRSLHVALRNIEMTQFANS